MSMNPLTELRAQVVPFVAAYDAQGQDRVWAEHSARFRVFWRNRIMASGEEAIADEDCDPIIRILDRNAKGNTKESQSVARAMVPQGAWRRMLNRLHTDKSLGRALDAVFTHTVPELKAKAVDELYRLNQGERNYLTGSSGNAVCAFLAAYDPVTNTSVISLRDRRTLLDYLGVQPLRAWGTDTIGAQIVQTNEAILKAGQELGLTGSARTISRFFFAPDVKPLWRGEHTVQLPGGSVSVAVPTDSEDDALVAASGTTMAGAGGDVAGVVAIESPANDEVRESMQIQALLARIGTQMGFAAYFTPSRTAISRDRGQRFTMKPDTISR